MSRFSVLILVVFILVFPPCIFSQQGASSLRDYVGLINQTYHPGIVSYFEKVKAELLKQKETETAKNIDIFLSGAFGSGFLYNDSRGNFYVLTNNHVVAQAHTLSITFERQDGTKRIIENLKIIAADEENDLAILALPPGERPLVTSGLTFVTRQVEEGDDVFSAGFPGLGVTPLWQFGRGMVSNANARFPKSINDETLIGPFIQHTAQVDAGNSGGPLLIAQRNAPSGYAAAGINTLKGIQRQAANYAVPVNILQTFINNALNPMPETYREALDQRLAKFTEGLNKITPVYPHISEFLSSSCIGENAEYAFEEMIIKANKTVTRTFFLKCEESIIDAMGIAVAWTIQESIKGRSDVIASVKEVTGSDEEYTVVFTINGRDVTSVWIREHGNWRIKNFGSAASGDTERLVRRQNEKETAGKLRLKSKYSVEAGYSNLFDKASSALYAGFDISFIGLNIYFAGSDFIAIGANYHIDFPIPTGNFGIIPYVRFGFNYQIDKEYKEFQENNESAVSFPIGAMVMAGLKLTTSYLPGVFINIGFQYNIINMHSLFGDDKYSNPMKSALIIAAGYAF